jgi:hypothetical protein
MNEVLSLMRRFSIRLRMVGAIAMVLAMFALVGLTGALGGARVMHLNEEFMEHTVQEIRLIDGPLFPDTNYEIEREVIALSATPKTESMWIRSRLFLPGGGAPVAEMDLNQAFLKASSPRYA